MSNLKVVGWCARKVVLWEKYVFKIPIWPNWIEESESEIELSKKSKLVLETKSLGCLWITSLEIDEILSIKSEDENNEVDTVILSELISVSSEIKKIISWMRGVDITKINVQRRLNLNMKRISKYFLYLSMNWLLNDFTKLVNNFDIANKKDEQNFIHTLSGFGNYWLTEEDEVLLLDWWITWEWKDILLSIWDVIYEIMNNEILVSQLLEHDGEELVA